LPDEMLEKIYITTWWFVPAWSNNFWSNPPIPFYIYITNCSEQNIA